MPVQRTKQQKQHAAEKRAEESKVENPFTFVAQEHAARARKSEAVVPTQAATYIVRDLLKTAVTSLLLFTVLIGIFFYLRYN